MFPENCSFVDNKNKCFLPPEYIIEVNGIENDKFMIGVTCFHHKKKLEKIFLNLQIEKRIPKGKLSFTPIKTIHTNCIKGNKEDEDEIKIKRL
ncbi:MAG: hypothetical protein ACTHKJ_05360 [Candidatus Nitrosocosmicus sp.]